MPQFTNDTENLKFKVQHATVSSKSIYTILSQGGKTISRSTSVWRAKVTPSMALLFFFLINNKLLTQDAMLRRNLSHTPIGCTMCAQFPLKDPMHLFFLCPFVNGIWDALSTASGFTVLRVQETPLLTYLASAPTSRDCYKSWIVAFITTTSQIWRGSNNRIFRNKSTTQSFLID